MSPVGTEPSPFGQTKEENQGQQGTLATLRKGHLPRTEGRHGGLPPGPRGLKRTPENHDGKVRKANRNREKGSKSGREELVKMYKKQPF